MHSASTASDTSGTKLGHIIRLIAGVINLAGGIAKLNAKKGVEMIAAVTAAADKSPVTAIGTASAMAIVRKIKSVLESKGFAAVKTMFAGTRLVGGAEGGETSEMVFQDEQYVGGALDASKITAAIANFATTIK